MLQEQSKLLSLSTELVLRVLDFTPNDTLISIAKTCRRLHYLALPIYLTRHGIRSNPVPKHLFLYGRGISALPGLTAALFVTSINDLSYSFRGHEEISFSSEVKKFHRFVYGLSSVSHVFLDVDNIDTRRSGGLATAASHTWKPGFIRLLDTVLERGCTSLTIAFGHFLVASSALRNGTRLEGPKAVYERTFLGLTLPLRRRKQPSSVLHIQPHNKLTSFSIHSDMLFSSPFYEWMLQALHANPITSLSLRVSGLSQDTWPLILNDISLPLLTSFYAETVDISFPALILFLQRHHTITTLSLHPYFSYPRTVVLPTPKPQKPQKFKTNHSYTSNKKNNLVPTLAALRGSPGNVKALLSHLHPDTALGIQGIALTLPMHQRVFSTCDFEALSAQIVGAVKGARPASLRLRFSVPFETMHPRPASEEEGDIRSVETLLSSVETVVFSTDRYYAFARWVVGPGLATWLGANFVNLRDVKLSVDCVLDLGAHGWEVLVQSIKDSCPGVRNVVFE